MGRAARRAHVATRNPRTRREGASRSFAFHRSSLASSSISAHVNRPNETFIQAVVSLFPPRPFSFRSPIIFPTFSTFDSTPVRIDVRGITFPPTANEISGAKFRIDYSFPRRLYFFCLSRNRDETMSREEERRGELAELDRNPSDVA